jgi:hypothetical protein
MASPARSGRPPHETAILISSGCGQRSRLLA